MSFLASSAPSRTPALSGSATRRLWSERDGQTYVSWAIQVDPDRIERESWRRRDVKIFNVPLDRYVEHLEALVAQSLVPEG